MGDRMREGAMLAFRLALVVGIVLIGSDIAAAQEVVSPNLVPPRVVKVVKAPYTQAGRAAGIEGRVIVEVVVSPEGKPTRASIVESLDAKHGLDDSAVSASLQWRFRPATRDGKPVEQAIRVEHLFKLEPQ